MGSEETSAMNRIEGVGHTSILSTADRELIKAEVIKAITEVLPDILVEAFPDVMGRILPNIISAMETKTRSHIEVRQEAERVMSNYQTEIKGFAKRRKKFFQQHERCVSLNRLYDECLEEQPPYIPRKFREDKFHVMDQEELEIVNRRSMANLRCQYDILSKRKRDFANKVNEEDDRMYQLVETLDIPGETKVEIINIWQKDTKNEESKVTQDWIRKVGEMKIAYEKDKETLAERNRTRFGIRDNVTVRTRDTSIRAVVSELSDGEDEEEDPVEQDRSAALFTNEIVSSDNEEQDDEDGGFGFSNETQQRVNDMVENFENEDTSHFRDVDHRTVPHDFFQLRSLTQPTHQQIRRNIFQSY